MAPLSGMSVDHENSSERSEELYYRFICVSVLARAFEAGLVAVMMPIIHESLQLNFTNVGSVAAAPDLGICTAALVGALVLNRGGAYQVLTQGYFAIGVTAVLCAKFPAFWTLCAARAFGGLNWGFAMVHYPVWINSHIALDKRTVRLAVFQSMMFIGMICGFLLGGAAKVFALCSWTDLYMLEGLLMIGCGVWGATFPACLVNSTTDRKEGPSDDKALGCFPRELRELASCPLFVVVIIMISACVSTSTFILYFISNLEDAFAITKRERLLGAIIGFVFGPLVGTIVGAKIVHDRGGYSNYMRTSQFATVSTIASFIGIISVAFSTYHFNKWMLLFSFLLELFAGVAPVSPFNGIAISIVPSAAHYASSVQFFCANFGKLLVPQIGGVVIDYFGLIDGFNLVQLSIGAVTVLFSLLAVKLSMSHGPSPALGLTTVLLKP